MTKDQLRVPQSIWKDKSIPKEAKYIYSYIYSKGYNRYFTTNKGLRKNLDRLEQSKYLVYHEYSNGMYTITLN